MSRMNDRHIAPLTRAIVTGDSDRPYQFRGYAAVFGQPAWIGPQNRGFWEVLEPAAFKRAVREDDVRFLVDHDPGRPLARTSAGNLHLTQDDYGLSVDANLVPTRDAADVAMLIEAGVLNQMSFAFDVADGDDKWTLAEDGKPLRSIRAVTPLFDVSIVAYPAYEGTEASLRHAGECLANFRTTQLATLRTRLEAAWKGATP